MKRLLTCLSAAALLALGGAASAQDFGPRRGGDDVGGLERDERRSRRGGDAGFERDDRGMRAGRDGDDDDGRRDRRRADRRFDDRDTRIVVRSGPTVIRRELDYRPGFVVTQPLRAANVVCRLVQERRFNPGTGVTVIRPVRECTRFVGRRRVIVSRQIVG